MNVLGLDIGYSNLKVVFNGKGKEVITKILPAGAAEASLAQHQFFGEAKSDDGSVLVTINGETWVAGIEPYRLQGWDRELHPDYPSTDTYKALFYAALLLTSMDTIDRVVTGLPVSQFKDPAIREALKNRMEGKHQITPKRTVTVKEALIVPQPAGAYYDSIYSFKDNALIKQVIQEGKMIVIDPGFFSVDWVVLQNGQVRDKSSDTSLKAMSMLLEELNRLLKIDFGASPSVNELESYVRNGKHNILIYGQKVNLSEYIEKASLVTARNALKPMRKTMREDGLDADLVLLAGGGAQYYLEATKELFPKSQVVMSDNSPLANARGFYYLGQP